MMSLATPARNRHDHGDVARRPVLRRGGAENRDTATQGERQARRAGIARSAFIAFSPVFASDHERASAETVNVAKPRLRPVARAAAKFAANGAASWQDRKPSSGSAPSSIRPAITSHRGGIRSAQADAGINFKHYVEIAQTAERGKFDMIFLADNICVREAKMEALSRSAQYIANFEPITLISALAARDRAASGSPARRRRATTSRSTSRASSPRSTTSAAAAPAGISSPPAWRSRRCNFNRDDALRPRRALRARQRVRRGRHRAVG